MARRNRSEERRRNARRAKDPQPLAASPPDRSRLSLGTTARITSDGEQFLTEHPELYQQSLSPYNPARWIGTDGATTRSYLALAESSGWPRRGMIVFLAIMLVGAVSGIAQMVGAIGARSGVEGLNFFYGLLLSGPLVLLSFAIARRLLRPTVGR